MLRVLKLLWSSLGEYYYDIVSLTGTNFLWLLTSFGPALLFGLLAQQTGITVFWLVSLLALVFVPPSFGALLYVTQQFTKGESVDRRTYAYGFRRFFVLSWKVALTDVIMGGLLAANCWFYITRGSIVFKLVGLIWLYGLAFWLCLQCYLWPLMVEQERKKLLLMYRNSALLIIDNIGFSISLAIVLVLFLALTVVLGLPLLILAGTVIGLVEHKALTLLLTKYQEADPAVDAVRSSQ